jgi:uncharacterized membrane protein HdeD (DUF308 family)
MRSSGNSRSGLELAYILSRSWLVLILRGLIAIILGVLSLRLTANSGVKPLIVPFAVYALADGLLGIGIVIGESARRGSWLALFFWGLSGVVMGILSYFEEPRSRPEFMWYIAIWAFATGVLEVMTAIRLRRTLVGHIRCLHHSPVRNRRVRSVTDHCGLRRHVRRSSWGSGALGAYSADASALVRVRPRAEMTS